LRNRLYHFINLKDDQILFIPLCGNCVAAMESLGCSIDPPEAKDNVIVV